MLNEMSDSRDPNSVAVRLRRKRFGFFLELVSKIEKPVRILDVGGTQSYWELVGYTSPDDVQITLLNVSKEPTTLPNFSSVVGDACRLDFPDGAFDVVFSNSVIEHVGSYADQGRMAAEVMRVGNRYFVQTPNYYFPIEPHFLFPMFQFLPLGMKIWLLRNAKLGWYDRTPDYDAAKSIAQSVQLLDRRELQALFPSGRMLIERFYGLPKSLTVYAGWS